MFCINLDPCTWSSREIQFSPFLDCYAKPIIEAMLADKSESTLGQPHMDKKSFEDKNGKLFYFFFLSEREERGTKPSQCIMPKLAQDGGRAEVTVD